MHERQLRKSCHRSWHIRGTHHHFPSKQRHAHTHTHTHTQNMLQQFYTNLEHGVVKGGFYCDLLADMFNGLGLFFLKFGEREGRYGGVQHAASSNALANTLDWGDDTASHKRQKLVDHGNQPEKNGLGTGIALITFDSKDRELVAEKMRKAPRYIHEALHSIFVRHAGEVFSVRDSTTREIFADGYNEEQDFPTRLQRTMARMDVQRDFHGHNIPAKLADGKLVKVVYTFPSLAEPFSFEVKMQ